MSETLVNSTAPIILSTGTATGAVAQLQKRNRDIVFPGKAIVGSLGEFAGVMAEGTEVPEEFYFAAALTFIGAACGSRLTLNANLGKGTRLYTVLLGESGDVKKSTALRSTADFFKRLWENSSDAPLVCDGVGSAEGLARKLNEAKSGLVLSCDELKAIVQKTRIEASVLLPMMASLFEQTNYENCTKNHDLKLEDAHLSIVGCCTNDTYAGIWDRHSIAIGFPNRLFVVLADRRRKECWPAPRDAAKLEQIRQKVSTQLARLPLTFGIEPDAKAIWSKWYEELPASIHAKRLDTIGFRLLALLAFTTDKNSIDRETVERVISILNYELDVRTVTDPLDADNLIAELEQKIMRQLDVRGSLWRNELWKMTNGQRAGVWFFEKALTNLTAAEHIRVEILGKKRRYHPSRLEESLE